MGEITLWLSVYEKFCPSGAYELWTRKLHTDFPPREGDTIHLWPAEDPDDGVHGVAWTVRRHYWGSDGSYDCELTQMVVDPDENDTTQRPRYDGAPNLYASTWWTDREGGRPEPHLRRGGWTTYGEPCASTGGDHDS